MLEDTNTEMGTPQALGAGDGRTHNHSYLNYLDIDREQVSEMQEG
jgi:hypothetical protein